MGVVDGARDVLVLAAVEAVVGAVRTGAGAGVRATAGDLEEDGLGAGRVPVPL